MICNKCSHSLPDDSKFCQYCGSKVEDIADAPVETVAEEQSFEEMTPDQAVDAILKIQAQETIKAMEANSQTQPDNEDDLDFGLVPEKPIFTLALKSVDGEKEYLDKLYTVGGEKISYIRRGSMSVDTINGIIDVYDTFLPSGKPYKTVYINMYGAKTSNKAPSGFAFTKTKTTDLPKVSQKILPNENLVTVTNVSAIVLTIISFFSIIIALNLQDERRNNWEAWNTTAVYLVLLLILGAFLGFALVSLIKKRFKLISGLAAIPVLATIITTEEGSILSAGYSYVGYPFKYYDNFDIVDTANKVWIVCVCLTLFVTLIPVIVLAIKKINDNWHKSVSYREKCYKRVAKIHSYLEKGIITEEEYEKTKSDILKYIN